MSRPCACGADLADCYINEVYVCYDCGLAEIKRMERETQERRRSDRRPWS